MTGIFPVGALAVLGALECKTVVEMAQSLLEQEEAAAREEAKEIQKAFENIAEEIEDIREEVKRKEGQNETKK